MLEVIQWKSVNVKLESLTMVFIFKIIKRPAPSYSDSFIEYNNEIREHNTPSKKIVTVHSA